MEGKKDEENLSQEETKEEVEDPPKKRGRGRPKGSFKLPESVRNKEREGNGIRGGKRTGSGRPKGSKNIHSHESVKKLQDLNFDPIERMVYEYEEICRVLDNNLVRVGSGAYAQLIATKATLINNLMQYGYKRIPEKTEVENSTKSPISITLTTRPSG
jgi:hypothetical protein